MKHSKPNTLLHFSTRSYPTFGRGKSAYDEANPPATVTSSPYYWWFKFLRLNEDYKATCKAGGAGKLAELYAHFGDVYIGDFKTWWKAHAHLFAEERCAYSFRIAKSERQLVPFDSQLAVNVTIPLTYDRQSLLRMFENVVLSKVPESKRGVQVKDSQAAYKLSGKWNCDAMATAYKVYLLRQQALDATDFERTVVGATEKKNAKRYSISWADIAIRAGLTGTADLKEGVVTSKNSDDRRQATVLAMRHYKRALAFIDAATAKAFPYPA